VHLAAGVCTALHCARWCAVQCTVV
jgi:hypothetical protein